MKITKSQLEAISTLASQLHHDLRNPLSVIQLALNDSQADAELRTAAIEALHRIKAVMDELGRLSKVSQVNVSSVELNPLFSSLIGEVRVQYPEKSIALDLLPKVAVKADHLMLFNVLLGLSVYCFKRGSEKIHISLKKKTEQTAEVLISDWGSIASEKELEILHAYQQVIAMGGEFSVLSPGHDGSTTTVQLSFSLA